MKVVGGSRLTVCGYGTVKFTVTVGEIQLVISIDKILYVPSLGKNLISIAAVTDVCLSVHFIEAKVTFEKGQSVIMVGERLGKNLYHLAILPTLTESQTIKDSACLAVPSPPSIEIWHQRFAHVNFTTLKRMLSNHSVDGFGLQTIKAPNRLCLGCVQEKCIACLSPLVEPL